MRKFSLIVFGILFGILTICSVSKAEITVKDYMSIDFLDKQGYSPATLQIVEINKAKTFGETFPKPVYKNKCEEYYKKFMIYIDPAQDDGEFGLHEIKMVPSTTGL